MLEQQCYSTDDASHQGAQTNSHQAGCRSRYSCITTLDGLDTTRNEIRTTAGIDLGSGLDVIPAQRAGEILSSFGEDSHSLLDTFGASWAGRSGKIDF